MVRCNCSGVVFEISSEYRLLHFFQVNEAWKDDFPLSEITHYSKAGLFNGQLPKFTSVTEDYLIQEKPRGLVVKTLTFGDDESVELVLVWSRYERYAEIYLANSPGYVCTGTLKHPYPPLDPRPDGKCAARPCPGSAPP